MNKGIGYLGVFSLAYNGNNFFAGINSGQNIGGVFLSTNSGTSWTHTSFNNQSVYSLTTNGIIVYAGTFFFGVYKSTDNGTNWTQTSLNNQSVYSLATNGNNVFAGTDFNGVYKSTNNGTNWTQTSLNNRNVYTLVTNGNNVFAGTAIYSTNGYGVYLSTNNGTTWAQTALNNVSVYSLTLIVNNLFAGTRDSGVYRSTNNGTNWTHTSLNNQNVISLAIDGNNIFAGTSDSGVYVSNDNGANWIQRNEGLSTSYIFDFCILNNYIFAGTYPTVYRRPLNELIGIQPISNEVPTSFSLSQNYPNPFNPSTKIKFEIPLLRGVSEGRGVLTSLIIFDVLGREIATLINEELNPGIYEVELNASNNPSGVYYYRLASGDPSSGSGQVFADTKKMVLLK
jgi:hypothetical protein